MTNYEAFFDAMLVGLHKHHKNSGWQQRTLGSIAEGQNVLLRTYAAVQFAEDCDENLFAEIETSRFAASSWKARILPAGIRYVEETLLQLAPIDSSRWTGLEGQHIIDAARRAQLITELLKVEQRVESLSLTNSEKSQVRSFIVAARILADSPDPPDEIIWELIAKANNLAGVASLFVAIMALFASVGK